MPLAVTLLAVSLRGQESASTTRPPNAYIPFSEAHATFDTLHESWPAELRGLGPGALEALWPQWVRRRDEQIRARLERGNEDSVVNLWLYGTTFTKWPRAVEPDMAQAASGKSAAEIVAARLDDLLDAMADPQANERLQFARDVFERRGMRPTTADGRSRIRRALLAAGQRALDEFRAYDRQVDSAQDAGDPSAAMSVHSTLFRDRGLSSDTSILISFAVEQALHGMISTGTLARGRIRRVAIVGPGLDFTNKADGHDFYPQQTIQPFALEDSLLRLDLVDPSGLRVTTFDLNARVGQHLARARERAEAGDAYMLHLPINRVDRWRPEFLEFWARVGDRVGENAPAAEPPWGASTAMVRAVRVRPSHVLSMEARDLNVILERPTSIGPDDQFDLVVVTNVLIYYDRFEQSLALANAAAMLRPGGVLLTNSAVFPIPPFQAAAHYLFVTYSDRQSEHVFWYQRQ